MAQNILAPELEPETIDSNLTELEILAINSPLNFADGHARQDLTANQLRIIEDLPALFRECVKTPVQKVEEEAINSYFTLLGQHGFPGVGNRVLSCYSSSVAMDIVAHSLISGMDSLLLLHPTFDNIPDILKEVGMRLVPLPEEQLHADGLDVPLLTSVGGVFITTPNNPTGRVLSRERLLSVARQCAAHDKVLVLDTSFRGFDTRAQYDHYEVLEASDCRWIVIEDTGKLWPTLDLKVGWIVTSDYIGLPVQKVHSNILLGVSPFALALAGRFAADAADDGLTALHRFIAGNRAAVRRGLAGLPGVAFPDAGNRGSVERIALANRTGSDVWRAMRDRNIYVLPCEKFYWADPRLGANEVRLALARPAGMLATAVAELRSVLLAG